MDFSLKRPLPTPRNRDSVLDWAHPPVNIAAPMRLLDRYLLRELLVPLAYCLGGFLVFWISFDLLGDLERFQAARLTPGDLVEYYLVLLPEIWVTVSPVALLLALLYALSHHARHNELTAIRAAGVSLWRACLPYFGVGAVFSGLIFVLNEVWVPVGQEQSERILRRHEPGAADSKRARWHRNVAFHNERHRRLWNIGLYDRDTGSLWNVNVDWELENGMRRRISARYGVYTNGAWVFYGVRQLFFSPLPEPRWETGETNQLELVELSETPSQINTELRFATLQGARAAKRASLSLREIREYQDLHPTLPEPARRRLESQFHARLAEPWTCLVVVLMAIPFGAPGARRNVFAGVAASIFLVFGFFFTRWLALALGMGGHLPPWLGAWLPHAIFGLAGFYLTWRAR